MSRYSDAARVTPDSGVLHQQVEDEVVLLHVASDAFYGLDPVAARMWELLEAGASLPGVVAAIVDEYEVTAATARTDLERLIDELAAAGLVHVE